MQIQSASIGRDQPMMAGERLTILVHPYSGEVVEVRGATGVTLTGRDPQVVSGQRVLASFPRDQVYYTVREEIASGGAGGR